MKGCLSLIGLGLFLFIGTCALMSGDDDESVPEEHTSVAPNLSQKEIKKQQAQAELLEEEERWKKLLKQAEDEAKEKAATEFQSRLSKEDLETYSSDDAQSVDEGVFHSLSRSAVIMNVHPNKLNVGGADFRVKRNPFPSGGAFVYNPKDVYGGVARNLVWWVPDEDHAYESKAYPLNSPSKMVTPELPWPRESGLVVYPQTKEVVDYIFKR